MTLVTNLAANLSHEEYLFLKDGRFKSIFYKKNKINPVHLAFVQVMKFLLNERVNQNYFGFVLCSHQTQSVLLGFVLSELDNLGFEYAFNNKYYKSVVSTKNTAGLDIVLPDRLEIRRQDLFGAWRTPDQPKYAEPGHFDPCFYEFKSELKAKIAQLDAVEDSLKAWGK